MATGDSQQTISLNYRVGRSTVCKIIEETCQALCGILQPIYLKPPASQWEWLNIAKEFESRWNFRMCVRSLDGKHIVIQAPSHGGSEFFNYKGQHSIVLLAICDANYRFTVVDIGNSGRHSDGGVFANSTFGKDFLNNRLALPPPGTIPGTTVQVPYCFVADAAFQLRPNLMRPFAGSYLPQEQLIFNYRLSRARRVIENSFGILATRFRIFRRPIIAKVEKAVLITRTACCLHNYLQTNKNDWRVNLLVDNETNGVLTPGSWRAEGAATNLTSIGQISSKNSSNTAKEVRQVYTTYFNSAQGSLPWQAQVVNRI